MQVVNTYNTALKSSMFEKKNGQVWLKKEAFKQENNQFLNFDLSWEEISGAKSYVIIMVDYEASRVIGQPFIHWLACGIKTNHVKFGASVSDETLIQGVNSTCKGQTDSTKGVLIECIPSGFARSFNDAIGYFPPMPPDKQHLYTIKVYGVTEANLNLTNGFFYDDLHQKLLNKVVGMHTFNFWANN